MAEHNRYKSYDDALVNVSKYSYALLYKFSEVKLCKADKIVTSDWDECTEARIFDDTEEVHIFPLEEKFYQLSDSAFEFWKDEKFILSNFTGKVIDGKTLVVRKYIALDQDGQAYIKASRLVSIR